MKWIIGAVLGFLVMMQLIGREHFTWAAVVAVVVLGCLTRGAMVTLEEPAER